MTNNQSDTGQFEVQYPRLHEEDWLREKYIQLGWTQTDIRDEVGCSLSTVGRALESFGIEKHRAAAVNTVDSVSDEIQSILDGELLADGHIRCYRDRDPTSGGTFRYTTANHRHRDWLADRFEQAGFETNRGQNQDEDYANGVRYRFQTLTYEWLGDQWERWYDDDKMLPSDFELTPFTLRHAFIGDGTVSGGNIVLYTMSYDPSEVHRLIQMLISEDIQATRQESTNSIYIRRGSHDRFYQFMASLPSELEEAYGYKWEVN